MLAGQGVRMGFDAARAAMLARSSLAIYHRGEARWHQTIPLMPVPPRCGFPSPTEDYLDRLSNITGQLDLADRMLAILAA